jgi:hypothetical protein
MLKDIQLHNLYNEGHGMGNLSHTLNKSILGVVSTGKWIGEETVILQGELPQLYSAVCLTEVKAYELNVEDYKIRFPQDIKTALEAQIYPKLYEFRDKFRKQN